MNLVNSTDDDNNLNGGNERGKVVRIEKVQTTICGMEKREVFQQAILPILTMFSQNNK